MIAVTVSIFQGILFFCLVAGCGSVYHVFMKYKYLWCFFLSLRAKNSDVHIINDVIKSIHKLYFEWHSHHFLSIQT